MLKLARNLKWPFLGIMTVLLASSGAIAGPTAVPGSINYVEGQVSLNGHTLKSNTTGSAQMEAGQVLETGLGKAEVLLTPGIFFRLGDHSALRLVSPALTNTQVELLRGDGMLEVAELFKENHLTVLDSGATTLIRKQGLYEFNAATPKVAVYDGEALVSGQDKEIKLKKGKETSLLGPLHAQGFDRDHQDELYAWSRLRSEYDAQAGAEYAQNVVVAGGPWWGPGWYWNPWWSTYAFLPGDGILYSPFGWGFYSPFAVYPGFGFYGHGFYGRGFVGRGFVHGRPPVAAFRGGHAVGGFRGGAVSGFHGGGMGGGFHGGGGRR